jgi:hypothetical protein
MKSEYDANAKPRARDMRRNVNAALSGFGGLLDLSGELASKTSRRRMRVTRRPRPGGLRGDSMTLRKEAASARNLEVSALYSRASERTSK